MGRCTLDGRHDVTADWGRRFEATPLEGRRPPRPSLVSLIRLGDPTAGSHARLVVVGRTPTDLSSEGLAASPDGRWVARVSRRGSAFPPGHLRHDRHTSVTLLRFDAATGMLRKVGETPLDGALPEGRAFDRSSRDFIATVYEAHPGEPGAGFEVFRVTETEDGGLLASGRWAFPVGAHHVAVAP